MGSIRHTDNVLAGVHAALREAGQPFSLIYLADHGLRHEGKDTPDATALHDQRYKQSYATPFFILSSDATAHVKMDKEISGTSFIKGVAQWMGIQVE